MISDGSQSQHPGGTETIIAGSAYSFALREPMIPLVQSNIRKEKEEVSKGPIKHLVVEKNEDTLAEAIAGNATLHFWCNTERLGPHFAIFDSPSEDEVDSDPPVFTFKLGGINDDCVFCSSV